MIIWLHFKGIFGINIPNWPKLWYNNLDISGKKKAPGAYFLELNALASLQLWKDRSGVSDFTQNNSFILKLIS
jgi:hypothetical protein